MDSITIRVQEDTLNQIDTEAETRGISKSELIREWFHERDELRTECEELRSECERLQTERDRLQRQLAATNRRVDEHQELVEYIEEQREIEHQRQTHEQCRREANVLKRGWWWLAGEPSDDE